MEWGVVEWSGVGCVIRKPKNVSYVVESGNGERRKQKVISIFEWLNNYLFSLKPVSEPIERESKGDCGS